MAQCITVRCAVHFGYTMKQEDCAARKRLCPALVYLQPLFTVMFLVSRSQSKLIAGKIIPAIATTTAAVAGLMCLELYKLVQGHQKISSYRTSYFILAVQYFVWCQPRQAQSYKVSNSSLST